MSLPLQKEWREERDEFKKPVLCVSEVFKCFFKNANQNIFLDLVEERNVKKRLNAWKSKNKLLFFLLLSF